MDSISVTRSARTFGDGSEQERGLDGWTQHYAQSEPGAYRGSIARLSLPGLTVSRERVERAVEESVVPPEGRVIFVHGLSRAGPWRVNAEMHESRFAGFLRGGDELLADLPPRSDVLMVEADRALFASREEIAPAALALRAAMVTLAPAPEVAALAEWFAHLLAAPGLVSAIVPDLALYNLGRFWSRLPGAPQPRPSSGPADYRLFRRAEALLREREAGFETFSVAGLAAALDVPIPALRQAFAGTVGVGPSDWLRRHRLDGARRDLRAGGGEARVTDIAMKWGFVHLGRFSAIYAAQFGEPPSATLRRARGG